MDAAPPPPLGGGGLWMVRLLPRCSCPPVVVLVLPVRARVCVRVCTRAKVCLCVCERKYVCVSVCV